MKKKYLLAVCLCITFLAGCEKTPDEVIVKEKGAGNISQYESGEKTKSPLSEALGIPEHLKKESSYQDGALVIDTDADIYLPDTNSIDTVSVSAKEVNQNMIDTVTKAFFEGDKIYHGYSYHAMTKDDIQDRIMRLKKYKAEGNMDPYNYGKDEEGNSIFIIDERIESLEELYKTAPDKIEKKEVLPSFGLPYFDGEKEVMDENHFDGTVETKDGVYSYFITSMEPMTKDIVFKISKKQDRDDLDPMEFSSWTEGAYFRSEESESYISEEVMKKLAAVSYEEAEKLAKESVDKLGWDLEIYGWDYALFSHGEQGVKEETCLDGGYKFFFTRKVNNIPITYTASYGGSIEDMESTTVPWGYEVCTVIVGDDGVQEVEIMNPYDIGETQTENAKLMDFDSIVKIYEQMMEVSNADITQYEKQRTYHVKRITLGYSRIYDPNADNTSGLLVPVWDFFGGFDIEADDYSQKDSGTYSTESFMTINAIDGTIIDRGLGY